jgi:hypothetical protein
VWIANRVPPPTDAPRAWGPRAWRASDFLILVTSPPGGGARRPNGTPGSVWLLVVDRTWESVGYRPSSPGERSIPVWFFGIGLA